MGVKVRIVRTPERVEYRFPYDAELKDYLKSNGARWDPGARVWWSREEIPLPKVIEVERSTVGGEPEPAAPGAEVVVIFADGAELRFEVVSASNPDIEIPHAMRAGGGVLVWAEADGPPGRVVRPEGLALGITYAPGDALGEVVLRVRPRTGFVLRVVEAPCALDAEGRAVGFRTRAAAGPRYFGIPVLLDEIRSAC
jgi:hypothetical protein